MKRQKVIVLGLGEVGSPLYEVLQDSEELEVYGWDLEQKKVNGLKQGELPDSVNILHICYPCIDRQKFVETTANYMKQFNPDVAIINSTIPPGTTSEIHEITKCNLVHSPVRGMHRSGGSMKSDLKFWTKYLAGVNEEAAFQANEHFKKVGLKTKVLASTIETELAKLFETTYRAWMITCFQEMHRISKHFDADFTEVVDMLADVHRARFNKPLHFPGVIRGHCLIPNVRLLLGSYDSEFLRLILTSNEQRMSEIKEKDVRNEVEKVKEKVRALDEELRMRLLNR